MSGYDVTIQWTDESREPDTHPYHERRHEMAHCPQCLSPNCYSIVCDEYERDERDEGP